MYTLNFIEIVQSNPKTGSQDKFESKMKDYKLKRKSK